MKLLSMIKAAFLIGSLTAATQAQAEEWTLQGEKFLKKMEPGYLPCFTIRDKKNGYALNISIDNKAIKIVPAPLDLNNKGEDASAFNQMIYNSFFAPFKTNQSRNDKVTSLTPKFILEDRYFKEPNQKDPFLMNRPTQLNSSEILKMTLPSFPKVYDYGYTQSPAHYHTLKGDQQWNDQLLVSKENIGFHGTKIQCEKTVFGMKNAVSFFAPENSESDIIGIRFEKLEGYHYLYMNGTIDFSNPNIFVSTDGNPFFVQGAGLIAFTMNPKLIVPFKPLTVVFDSGLKIERLDKGTIRFVGATLSSQESISISKSGFEDLSTIHPPLLEGSYVETGATEEEFLEAVRRSFGPIKEIIRS